MPNPELPGEWYERPYRIIAMSETEKPYAGIQKWWTPSDNSVCIPICISEQRLFEEAVLYPYFHEMIHDFVKAPICTERLDTENLYRKEDFLNEVFLTEKDYDTLVAVLKHKKNLILQGAPGVGKTFAAKRLAYSIMGEKDEGRIKFIQFHQNYSYEDFIMGYKPAEDGFELRMGIFYSFCKKAKKEPTKEYFFIIDEINRGNLSKIFGELLMMIEYDYRGVETTLAYNGESFSVPENLYIIGMMNTADRSLAMMDYALRRRFSFFEMRPGFASDGFRNYQEALNSATFDSVVSLVQELNSEIEKDKSLGKSFCIGHSYFCGQSNCTEQWLRNIIRFEIIPMLEEYWFDDTAKVNTWQQRLNEVFHD